MYIHANTYCIINFTLDTYDLRSVVVEGRPGAVCVTCRYIPSSPTPECLAVVTSPDGDMFNLTVRGDGVERCTTRIGSGPYVVKVFDVFDDGSVREQPTKVTELVVIAAPSPSLTSLFFLSVCLSVCLFVCMPVCLFV